MIDTTQGNGSPQESQAAQAPTYMTADEFNRAFTAREKATEKKLEKFLADFSASFTAKFEELKPKQAEDPKDKPSEQVTQFNALQAKYQELAQKFEAEQKARADAERKAREDSAYSTLKQQLIAAKIRPEQVDVLADALFSGRNKRVEFDEAGNPLFKVKVAPAKGLAEEDQLFSLEDGIKHFAKSKEAESWLLPPSGAGNPTTAQPRQVAPVAGAQSSTGNPEQDRNAQLLAAMQAAGITFP